VWWLMRQAQQAVETRAHDAQERLKAVECEAKVTAEKLESVQRECSESQAECRALRTTIEERERSHAERLEAYQKAEDQLKDTFKALSGDALKQSTEQLVSQAEEVLKRYKEVADGDEEARRKEIDAMLAPMKDRLKSLDEQNQQMERHRAGAYKELMEQVRALNEQQATLKTETSRLVRALQDPGSAGSWGEMVLERVVEMAGLEGYWSYLTQESVTTDDGRQRPDMLIQLPGGRSIVIDSKAPMRSYVTALETEDGPAKDALMIDHAAKLLGHARELKRRDYSKTITSAPDFVVLFVPSESAYRVAVERRPALFEEAHEANVVMATPTTLLALLKAVAYGWRQEKLADSARQLQADAATLYERVCKIAGDYAKLGKAIGAAGRVYNELAGSLESRVLPAARKFKDHGVQSNTDMAVIDQVEFVPRQLTSPEFVTGERPVLPGTE